jgi:mevalonate kinase
MDGAKAIALPCKKGQRLKISPLRGSDLVWESFDEKGELWFESQISLYDFSAVRTSDKEISRFIQKLLKGAVQYNSEFLNNWNGYRINTHLEFSRHWGLGSSSSLIYAVSEWADVNPFHLYFELSSGSAYDIACAFADCPIVYEKSEESIHYEEVDLNFPFEDNLFLIHQGRKQNTEAAINYYRKTVKSSDKLVNAISEISNSILECQDRDQFEKLILEHEKIISEAIGVKRMQDERYLNFNGTIKSLGAWGGDFILAVTTDPLEKVKEYFSGKGLQTVIPYLDLILK